MEISVLLSFPSVPHRVQDADVLFLELTDNFLLQILLLLSTIFPGSFNLPQGWTWKAQLDLILLLLLIASVAIEHLNPNPARKGFLQSYFKIISLGSPKSCLSLYLLSVHFCLSIRCLWSGKFKGENALSLTFWCMWLCLPKKILTVSCFILSSK